ncbi:ABC transporter permease subunit [Longispora urticae]
MSEAVDTGGSRIHDIGYRRYEGANLGRLYVARSLYTHGLRSAFGLGRSAKAKIFPWIMVGLLGAFAVVVAAVRAQTGEMIVGYQEFQQVARVIVIIFLAVVAPELVSRDLRNKTLPLYFSRPLRRTDYALAKLAAVISAVFLLVAGPLTIVGIAAAFSVPDVSGVWAEVRGLLGGYTMIAVVAVIHGSIALLIASLASKRAFAAGAIAAVFLVLVPIAQIPHELAQGAIGQLSLMISPDGLVDGLQELLFGKGDANVDPGYRIYYGIGAVALVAALVTALITRYRKVSL